METLRTLGVVLTDPGLALKTYYLQFRVAWHLTLPPSGVSQKDFLEMPLGRAALLVRNEKPDSRETIPAFARDLEHVAQAERHLGIANKER